MYRHLVKLEGKIDWAKRKKGDGLFRSSDNAHRNEGGVLHDPEIFKPADEERVAKAIEVYRKAKAGRTWKLNEAKHRAAYKWKYCVFGIGTTIATSGMLGYLTDGIFQTENPLWFGAHHVYRIALAAWPGLFATLSLEIGGAWYLLGDSKGKKVKAQANASEKAWEGNKFENDELVHVFTRENGLNPQYDGGQVYLYKGKPIPESAWTYCIDFEGKRVPLPWTRYQRDGKFYLVLGEYYERDGRWNDEPKLARVPVDGLYTGILLIGPPGSGKSQSTLLPFLDQFVGYYHWVPSEFDLWMKEIPRKLERMKEDLKHLEGAEKDRLSREAAKVEEEYQKRLRKWKVQGEDFRTGAEAMAGFLWEPKAEMYAEMQDLLKRFGREQDYIELGVVPVRFERYQEWKVKLQNAVGGLWSYQTDFTILDSTKEWLLRMADRNVVPLKESPRDDEWTFVPARGVVVLPSADEGHARSNTRLTYNAIDKVYDTGGDRDRWLTQITGGQTLRHTIFEGPNSTSESSNYSAVLNGVAKHCFSPWCFPVDRKEDGGLEMVGPFGFGTKNEPWMNFRDQKAPRDANAQAIVGETIDAFSRLFGAFGGTFIFGRDSKAFFGGDGGFFRSILWGGTRETIFPFTDALGYLEDLKKEGARPGASIEGLQSGDLLNIVQLAPLASPTTVLIPAVKAGAALAGNNQTADDVNSDLIGQLLSYFPGDRVELTEVISAQVRTMAPIVRRPARKKADFRIDLEKWRANREWVKYGFIQALINGLDDGTDATKLEGMLKLRGRKVLSDRRESRDRGLAYLNQAFRKEGRGSVAQQVMGLMTEIFPVGMIECVISSYLNNPLTMGMAITDLVEAGWDVKYPRAPSGKALEAVLTWLGHEGEGNPTGFPGEWEGGLLGTDECPFDSFSVDYLRPGAAVITEVCREAKITLKGEGENPWPSLDSYHLGQRGIQEAMDGVLLASVVRRARDGNPFGAVIEHPLVDLFVLTRKEVEKAVAQFPEGDQKEAGTRVLAGSSHLKDAVVLIRGMREASRAIGLSYPHEPNVSLEDADSEELVDYEETVDIMRRDLFYGPWDMVWSEFVGEKLWEPLADLMRNTMASAVRIEAELEVGLVNEHPDFQAQSQKRLASIVESGYRARGRVVMQRVMGYFRACEQYLRAIPAYYKTNEPLSYGYYDKGGIGDCQGQNKFNPLHAPTLTPNQVADALTAVINRTAGSGDTDFWINNAGKIAAHMTMLLRAGLNYVTVGNLKQITQSEGFQDLVIRKAGDRINRLAQLAQGGDNPDVKLRKNFWGRAVGEVSAGRPMPARVRRLIPRQVSDTELNEIRELYQNGTVWLNEQWRKATGEFADKEVRGNSLSNLFTKLYPLTVDIGYYAFCPENEEENSFPTWPEVRTEGKIVVYRMNHTSNPILSGLVSGMAITSYQAMVLQTMEKRKASKELFKRSKEEIPKKQREMKALRQELGELKGKTGQLEGSAAALNVWLQSAYSELCARKERATPIAEAQEVFRAMLEAEAAGRFGGALSAVIAAHGLDLKPVQKKSVMARIGATATNLGASERAFLDELLRLFRNEVGLREEKLATVRDRIIRVEKQIWVLKQGIKNIKSEIEEFLDFNRYFFFVVDEYQYVKSFAQKRGGISDELFLAAARAGESLNVFCSQSLASIKAGSDEEAFNQFFTNIRIQICLGSSNKWDQETLSDFWRGRKELVEGDVNFSINYDAVDKDVSGQIRGSKAGGVNKTVSAKWEQKKWVEPDDLAVSRSMQSWMRWYDSMKDFEPHRVYHIPYYIVKNEKVSRVDGKPLALKTFVELVRDGEFDLKKGEDFSVRDALQQLQLMGVDMKEEMEAEEKRQKNLKG